MFYHHGFAEVAAYSTARGAVERHGVLKAVEGSIVHFSAGVSAASISRADFLTDSFLSLACPAAL